MNQSQEQLDATRVSMIVEKLNSRRTVSPVMEYLLNTISKCSQEMEAKVHELRGLLGTIAALGSETAAASRAKVIEAELLGLKNFVVELADALEVLHEAWEDTPWEVPQHGDSGQEDNCANGDSSG